MNTFLKNSLRTLGLLLIINLAACSSSDNDYNDSDNNNAPNEGVWRGLLTFDEEDGLGAVVDEDDSFDVDVVFADGRVMIITADDDGMFMYSGTYEYSDSDEEIGGDALEYGNCKGVNCAVTDNLMSFTGAETEPGIMHLEFDLVDKDDDMLVATGTIQLEFSDDEEGSALSDIEGSWATEGLAIFVEEDGSFDASFTNHSCNLSGEISILDPEYNLYDALSVIYGCETPTSEPLNGDYIGFAAVNYGDDDDDLLTIIGTDEDEKFMLFIEFEREFFD